LKLARAAEEVGFHAAMCSDHFHPWSEREGQSGFAWSWLGSALEATNLSFGTVCAPGQRYHPAIIAQAAATLAQMYPGRFWLAVGSGEALNESITGEHWPPKPERNARLKEAADVIRALWAGETVDHNGYFQVRNAKLFTRPEVPPLLLGAAITAETAAWLGQWADGLITTGSSKEELQKIVTAFRDNGGEHKPMYLQSALCLGRTKDEALAICYDQWRQAALDVAQIAELPTPAAFDRVTATTTKEELSDKVRISADFNELWDAVQRDSELGFERVYIHHLGRDLTRFLEASRRVLQ
jgi:coenzyme F420-dependent glucose-6-phosphate dehydrogenase